MNRRVCTACPSEIVADYQWRKMTPEQRKESRARQHRGRGLCSACYRAAERSGTLIDHEGTTRPRGLVIEELAEMVLEREVTDLDLLAEHLEMTRPAMNRALRRAANDGDPLALRIRPLLPHIWKDIAA